MVNYVCVMHGNLAYARACNCLDCCTLLPRITGERDMHLVVFVVALLLLASPAAAKDWMEYAYPDHSFTVAFPAEPRIEPTTYQAADGRAFAARTYSVTLDGSLFKMTVVELPDGNANGDALVSHAVKTLTEGNQIKLDIPHRIRSTYGRQLAL